MTYLGLDLGTSGVKALLIDEGQKALAEGHAPLEVQRPHPMWSEQDPQSWITACEAAIAQVRAAAPVHFAALRGIAVSGQMHGATLLDANDRPLRPAILWNDGRAHAECAELEARAPESFVGTDLRRFGAGQRRRRWRTLAHPWTKPALAAYRRWRRAGVRGSPPRPWAQRAAARGRVESTAPSTRVEE